MAILGYAERTTSLPAGNSMTACGWGRSPVDGAPADSLFTFGYASTSITWMIDATNVARISTFDTDGVFSATPTANSWFFWALTIAGSGSNQINGYLGRLSDATLLTISATDAAATGAATGMACGFTGAPAFTGVRVWDAVLSAAELEKERSSLRPWRVAGLHCWVPMLDAAVKDYSGNDRHWAPTGVTVTDSPPVPWGAPTVPPTFPLSGQRGLPVADVTPGRWTRRV